MELRANIRSFVKLQPCWTQSRVQLAMKSQAKKDNICTGKFLPEKSTTRPVLIRIQTQRSGVPKASTPAHTPPNFNSGANTLGCGRGKGQGMGSNIVGKGSSSYQVVGGILILFFVLDVEEIVIHQHNAKLTC